MVSQKGQDHLDPLEESPSLLTARGGMPLFNFDDKARDHSWIVTIPAKA